MPEFVGRGEKIAERILNFMYPGCYVLTQVPMLWIAKKYASHWLKEEGLISEENLNRTIDLFVVSGQYNKDNINMAVRVQDRGTHGGSATGKNEGKSKIDAIQKDTLEDWGITVVDIHETDCKELFKNRLNPQSVYEVSRSIVEKN